MSTHVKILGWLYIIGNGLVLVFALLFGALGAIVGVASGEPDGAAAGGLIGVLSMVFGLLAIPGIIIGWGLLNYRNWARIFGIIFSILGLLNFPIGTAIGIYALWVLFNDEVAAAFRRGAPAYGA